MTAETGTKSDAVDYFFSRNIRRSFSVMYPQRSRTSVISFLRAFPASGQKTVFFLLTEEIFLSAAAARLISLNRFQKNIVAGFGVKAVETLQLSGDSAPLRSLFQIVQDRGSGFFYLSADSLLQRQRPDIPQHVFFQNLPPRRVQRDSFHL